MFDARFGREFLSAALTTFIIASAASFVLHLFGKSPRVAQKAGRSKAKENPWAVAGLFAFIALLIYWAWPSPRELGMMAGTFLTIPVDLLLDRLWKKTGASKAAAAS
jgi:hypothetical protein